MTLKAFLTLGLLTTLIACSKEDITSTGNEKLIKIEINDPYYQVTSYVVYSYDNTGRLIEINYPATISARKTLDYDASGKITSSTMSNSVDGKLYRYDFQTDLNGRIIKAIGTSFQPNLFAASKAFTYDSKNRLSTDSTYTPSGSVESYTKFHYDDNDNVIELQRYTNNGSELIPADKMTFKYDNNRSPYFKIGQLLYAASGAEYFLLSRNNTITATLNDSIITPGKKFALQYYPSGLLKTSTANVPDALKMTFYYSE